MLNKHALWEVFRFWVERIVGIAAMIVITAVGILAILGLCWCIDRHPFIFLGLLASGFFVIISLTVYLDHLPPKKKGPAF